jgi:hypothetical protein
MKYLILGVSVMVLLGLAQPVPQLPFPDNLDPSLCGIPIRWGSDAPAWLDGHYQGKLIEPEVYLYESHARQRVVGRVKSGTSVKILLFQANPKLDYYLVQTQGLAKNLEGWVPGPFVRLKR